MIAKLVALVVVLSLVFAGPAPIVQENSSLTPNVAIGHVLNNETGNPASCLNGTRFFSQMLNHMDASAPYADNHTFPQQFQILSDFFVPGGPILLSQGAETPNILCAETLELYQAAKALGGLAVSLEHRFFGISNPFGLNFTNNSEWPTKSLASLTLENVMLDSVNFVQWIKTSFPGAESSKVFVFGGSYGGFLSAMLRIHYPDTFFGAIASSGVFNGLVTSPHDPKVYYWGNFLNSVYLDQSADVAGKIKTGFQELEKRMTSGQFSGLDRDLSLCYPPNATDQFPILTEWLKFAFSNLVQFNYGREVKSLAPFPLQLLVDQILKTNNSIAALNVASTEENERAGAICGDWNPVQRGSGQTIPFLWIQCTYFPYLSQIYTTADTIFGAFPPDTSVDNINDAVCQNAFNINGISAKGLQERYNITQNQLEASTRIIFAEGLAEPATSLGPEPFYVQSGSPNASRMLFISNGPHVSDLLAPLPNDSEALTDARTTEIEAIKEWMGRIM